MIRRLIVVTAVAVTVALLDAIAKAWALNLPAEGLTLLPVLDLRIGFNPGISFGLFSEASGPAARFALVVLPALIAAGVVWWAVNVTDAWERAGFALIAGGAIGNVMDRLPDGLVTDFLDMHAGGWHFPTFNVADVAITIGTALLGIGLLSPILRKSLFSASQSQYRPPRP